MTSLGFQLYSLHAVDEPLAVILERVGATPFSGVEFAGLDGASVEEVSAALDRTGLAAAGAHVSLEELEDDPAGVVERYRSLGVSDLTVAWLDPEHYATVDAVELAAERLSAAAETLADLDMALHYHNPGHEFVALEGELALDRLLAGAPTVGLQLDLGWVGAAGLDPLAFFEGHADRIDLVHLKDYDASAGEPAVVGEGDLDLARTVEAVRGADVDWLLYEAEARPDSYETLDHAAAFAEDYW